MARTRRVSKGVKFSGPFFQGDPGKKFADNVKGFMAEVAKAGEADVKARMASTPRLTARRPAGDRRTESYVVGRVRSLSGKPWRAYAVVSPSTQVLGRAEAISVRAAASVLEGRSHPFRNAKNAIRRAADGAAKKLLRGLT